MTMTINRKEAPAIQIAGIQFPSVQIQDNLHYIQGATQEYTFLQLIFDAGKVHSQQKLIADCCCDMLLSGTSSKNAFQLNELLDYYGASVEPILGDDDLCIRIYCLNKQLKNILPVLHEILSDSVFPEEEAQIILAKWKQRQLINFKKIDYLANRKFRNTLFGDEHPYGQLVAQEDFEKVQVADIRKFYENHIKHKSCKIILTGKLGNELIEAIQLQFANQKMPVIDATVPLIHTSSQMLYTQDMSDMVQSSIRVGKLLPSMEHNDYMGLYVLTCILGGYFSSRLMNNLREDKGYTYGIHATTYSKKYAGVFEISTEINKEFLKESLDEIKKEIIRLSTEPIEEEELSKVKNYLLGQLMRSIDGPIKTGKIYKTLLMQHLDFNFSKEFEKKIKSITAEELTMLATKYFDINSMHIVTIG